jgi:hypothetical protein
VLIEWWYWSDAEATVAIMAVRLLPLSPSCMCVWHSGTML